jgi:hypothetical protein
MMPAPSNEVLHERIIALEKVIHTRLEGNDKALELKSQELARRLEVLNHAHQEARDKEATFLPRETWEAFLKTNNAWRESVMVQLAANSGKTAAYVSMLATGLAVAGLIMQFMRR